MKKLLFVSFVVFLYFFSCKKSGSPISPAGSISATVDGVALTFNTAAVAVAGTYAGTNSLSITGFQGTAGSSDQIAIAVNGTLPITTGTYTFSRLGSTTNLPALSYAQTAGTSLYSNDATGANSVTISITSLSSSYVTGTFSGTLVLYSGTSAITTKKITNGKFSVGIQ